MRLGWQHRRLQEILSTMDVPQARLMDFGWLMRNLTIQNALHPDLDEALGHARFMHRVQRRFEADAPKP
jgi:hypothetical protein